MFGDDTYGSDDGSRLYKWRDTKEEKCEKLGHVARHDKECCYSTRGDLAHAPDSLPGSPHHEGVRLPGFKGVLAASFWQRRRREGAVARKMKRLYEPLDNVDKMKAVNAWVTL